LDVIDLTSNSYSFGKKKDVGALYIIGRHWLFRVLSIS